MENNPEYIIVGSHIQIIGKGILYYPISDESIKTRMLIGTPFAHPVVMIRADILSANNLFYLETYKHAEDYGFWVELSRFGKMANLDEVLLDYRRHETQYSVEYKTQMNLAASKARNHYLESFQLSITENTRDIMNGALDYYKTCKSQAELIQYGKVLEKFNEIFKGTSLNSIELEKLAIKLWKKLCLNFQKVNSYKSYLAFLKNKLSRNTKLNIHFFFLKSIVLDVFMKSSHKKMNHG